MTLTPVSQSKGLVIYHAKYGSGQTEARGDASFDALDSSEPSDFLSRERALLGDDANQFSTSADNTATVQDGDDDDDLLGGGGGGGYQDGLSGGAGDDMGGFESSFPAIDTQNEVRPFTMRSSRSAITDYALRTGRRIRRHNHRQ